AFSARAVVEPWAAAAMPRPGLRSVAPGNPSLANSAPALPSASRRPFGAVDLPGFPPAPRLVLAWEARSNVAPRTMPLGTPRSERRKSAGFFVAYVTDY